MQAFLLLALALGAGVAPATSAPPAETALAPIVCTPHSVQIPGQGTRRAPASIEEALIAARPGQSILLEPGDYPPVALGFQRQAGRVVGSIGGQAGLPVVVEGRGLVRIRGDQGDAIAIHQDVRTAHIVFRNLEIHPGTRAGVMLYRQPPSRRHEGIHFEDCHVLGQYDHLTDSGLRTKWGVWGHQLDDFRFVGMREHARIQDIALEHAFYLQNPLGDVLIERVAGRRLGRTFCQFTSRVKDGPAGVGDVTVRGCEVEDVGLSRRDGFKGGSAFTVTGRLVGTILFEDNTFLGGFDPALRVLRRPGAAYGTGAFVAWLEPDAQGMPNGLLVLRDNDFRFAKDCGDRPVVSIGGCRTVRIVGNNRFVSGGVPDALAFDPVDELGQLVSARNGSVFLAPRTVCEGRVTLRGNAPNEQVWKFLRGHR